MSLVIDSHDDLADSSSKREELSDGVLGRYEREVADIDCGGGRKGSHVLLKAGVVLTIEVSVLGL